jgi:DNA-binding CsgD family transcriptional regulator
VLGCSPGTVWRVTNTKRKRAKRRPSPSLKQQIRWRIEAGQSPREIAEALGCTVSDVAAKVWDREI